jgi:hypothetical protein
VREELAVEGLPQRGLVQGGDRADAHGAGAGGEDEVIGRSVSGEEGVAAELVRSAR